MSQSGRSEGSLLPGSFELLEPLVADWSLGTEHARREKRASSPFGELQSYYAQVGPRMRDIAAHLDEFPMGRLPAPQQRLLQLALMFMEVAIAVEFYGAPEIRNGFPRQRWAITPQ